MNIKEMLINAVKVQNFSQIYQRVDTLAGALQAEFDKLKAKVEQMEANQRAHITQIQVYEALNGELRRSINAYKAQLKTIKNRSTKGVASTKKG